MVKSEAKQINKSTDWVAAYAKWQESGLTQRTYCNEVGLVFTQFKAGIENARQQGLLERHSQNGKRGDEITKSEVVGFAPVQINQTAPRTAYCEIWFEGKAGIRIETAESLQHFVKMFKPRVINQ